MVLQFRHLYLNFRILFCCSVLLWFITTDRALAQGTESLLFTLKQAQEYAIEHNPTIHNAVLDVEIAKKVIWENTAMGLPQINGSVGYTNNLSLATTLIPAEFFGGEPGTFQEVRFGTQHNANAVLTASQLIFNGPYIVALQAAKIYKRVSEQTLEKTEYDVKEIVAQNYYLVLLSQETIKTLKENQQNLEKILNESRELYRAGYMEETDVDQLQVTLTSVENSVRSMERQLEIAINLFRYQMGIDPDIKIVLTEDLENILRQIDLEAMLVKEFNLNDHVDYRLLNTQEQLAYLDLRRTKAEYWPTLSAYFSNQRTALRNEFDFLDFDQKWFPSSMLGITLNVPIFSSGMKRSQVSQKRLTWEKSKNSKDFAAQGLFLENQQARYDFNTALEQYYSEKGNLETAGEIFERTSIKYREGIISSLDLTQVNNQYLQTQTSYISALFELLNAKIRLDRSLNQL
ncbi:MAG: TolC family protein [Bacteroidales bacterium]|nr:MAG: TolC family protein [Bacteroidales bacterium]